MTFESHRGPSLTRPGNDVLTRNGDFYNLKFIMSSSTFIEQELSRLKIGLQNAKDYDSWLRCAKKIDTLDPKISRWLQGDTDNADISNFLDTTLIRGRIAVMRKLAEENDRNKIMYWLRSGLVRNFGGMNNPKLYDVASTCTIPIIHQYLDLLIELFNRIRQCNEGSIYDSLAFFAECRHALGKSALLLSWGFNNGAAHAYHLGVIKTLHEQKLLPRVISGRSAGAVVVAIVCTRKGKELDHAFVQLSSEWSGEVTDDEKMIDLKAFYDHSSRGWAALRRWFSTGSATDVRKLRAAIRRNVGDLTFLDAFKRTGRIANILVTPGSHHEHPRLLNYLNAPDVLIWSAALASCAFPGLCPSTPLLAKSGSEVVPYSMCFVNTINPGRPGSRAGSNSRKLDLPFRQLKALFNVNYVLVSQANPQTIPFISSRPPQGALGRIARCLKGMAGAAVAHYTEQLLGLGLAPKLLAHFTNQLFTGDVTMIPPRTLEVCHGLVSLPEADGVARFGHLGERVTWGEMARIRGACELEVFLADCVRSLNLRARETWSVQIPAEVDSLNAFVGELRRCASGTGTATSREPSGLAVADLRRAASGPVASAHSGGCGGSCTPARMQRSASGGLSWGAGARDPLADGPAAEPAEAAQAEASPGARAAADEARRLLSGLGKAGCFEEWQELAAQLDRTLGWEAWRRDR